MVRPGALLQAEEAASKKRLAGAARAVALASVAAENTTRSTAVAAAWGSHRRAALGK